MISDLLQQVAVLWPYMTFVDRYDWVKKVQAALDIDDFAEAVEKIEAEAVLRAIQSDLP